jgi:hypothetical protein
MITKIILQTSREKPEQYIIDMISALIPSHWEYKHYVDSEIIDFFDKNVMEEFPNIIDKFNGIKIGAHKADLFRYYFLYLKGGVFIDSDAMIKKNIEDIVCDYSFFSSNSTYIKNSIFQGFIGSAPKNEIVYKALQNLYQTSNDDLHDYFWVVKDLYKIVNNYSNHFPFPVKLFKEEFEDMNTSKVIDEDDNSLILLHHYKHKKIPLLHIKIPDGSWIKSAKHYKIENKTLYADLVRCDNSINSTSIEIDYNFKYLNDNGKFKTY